MPKLSAGILLYRPAANGDGIEIFLVHPGGPFWARKDDGAWSIPKGLVDPNEDHAAAARREFTEEVGAVPPGELVRLGEVRQSGKNVIGFALEGDFDPAALVSNTVEIEWPPRTGRRQTIPEVDRAGWFSLDIAHNKLVPGQRPFIDTLARLMNKDPTLAPSR